MRENFIKYLQSMTDKEFENFVSGRVGACPEAFGLQEDIDVCTVQTGSCCLECWKKALKI